MTAFASLAFVACGSSDDDTTKTIPVGPQTKTIEWSQATSGVNSFNGTLTRAGESYFQYYKYQDYQWTTKEHMPADFAKCVDTYPGAVTQEEKAFVINYIKEHPNEGGTEYNYVNYWIQNIGSSYDTYYNLEDMNHAMHQVTGGNQMDYLVINNNHINDYNASWGPDALCLNLPVVDPTYHDSWGDKDNTKHNAYKFYQITYNGKKGWYLCFDYRTAKNSGELHSGDGVYNDWVVKLTPADDFQTVVEDEEVVDGFKASEGMVEVNLAVNAEKEVGDYIATKLSIHVRDTTDVEVFIPVPRDYYCDSDDMAIVLSNPQEALVRNTKTEVVSYTIGGQTVNLNVRYEDAGIRVTTSGITKEILKYCRQNFGDGITFEVWNYFTGKTREQMKEYWDASTVKFIDENTNTYVNALNNELDFKVTPVAASSYDKTTNQKGHSVYTRK